ncbi:hypothetical protein G6F37_011964 [Rhizopus arrhizus]|nr:hypothetical protein G6F37_011964 [Rhizopus arrhizus]KAG1146962.1 hypothetical protein G6F38_004577 [Rhizopus arrhizus]
MVRIAAKADIPSLLKPCEDHSYKPGYRWNATIGVHPKGFSPLLGTRFYNHIVRAQLEYGLAIPKITTLLSKKLSFYIPLLFLKMLCYTIFFHISASPEATSNGTDSLGLPFGRDASTTQNPCIVAL